MGDRRRGDAGGAGRHDEVLRAAIEAHGGCRVQAHRRRNVRRVRSPSAAIDAAVDAQRELTLPVRMGIATGEAETATATTSARR